MLIRRHKKTPKNRGCEGFEDEQQMNKPRFGLRSGNRRESVLSVTEIRGQKGVEQMFDYNTPHAKGLREFFASCHRDNALVQFAGEEFSTTDTLHDGTNIIRAILVIADTMTEDEFETMFEDIANSVDAGILDSAFPVIAEEYDIALNGYEFAEFEDGSVAVIPATVATATDTETVTVTHADGTVTVRRQNADDIHAVIRNGHRVLMAQFENGIISDYADDISEELVTENDKYPTTK